MHMRLNVLGAIRSSAANPEPSVVTPTVDAQVLPDVLGAIPSEPAVAADTQVTVPVGFGPVVVVITSGLPTLEAGTRPAVNGPPLSVIRFEKLLTTETTFC